MKTMTKIVMLSASLLGLTTLSACQPYRPWTHQHMMYEERGEHYQGYPYHMAMDPNDMPYPYHMARDPDDMPYHYQNYEQRMQWKQRVADRQAYFEQMRKACDGKKAGQNVQVKFGDKVIEGSCELNFQPKNPMPYRIAPRLQAPSKPAS